MAQSPDEVDLSVRGGHASTPTEASTDEIRSQIEETRADMSDTIDAIQTRLNPKRVFADAKESVTEATTQQVKRLADRTNDARGRAMQYAQDNPVPSALMATAAVGLLVGGLTSATRRRRRGYRYRTGGSRMSPRRLLAMASAGAACWYAWRRQQHAGERERAVRIDTSPVSSTETSRIAPQDTRVRDQALNTTFLRTNF